MFARVLPLLAALGAVAPGPRPEIAAPVSKVVVYGDRVRMTRTLDVDVKDAGQFALPLLPREVEDSSVRVEVVNGRGLALERVAVRRLSAQDLPQVQARVLLNKAAQLEHELQLARDEATTLTNALSSLGTLPEADSVDTASIGPDPARWRETFKFLRTFAQKLEARRWRHSERVQDLTARRSELGRAAERLLASEGQLEVVVSLRGTGRGQLAVSYLLPGPRWRPRYQLRLDPTRDEMSVRLLAEVAQMTGEDWHGVGLTVSTASGEHAAALPTLPRWTIGERRRFIPTTVSQATNPPGPVPVPRADKLTDEAKRLHTGLLALAQPPDPPPPLERANITESFDLDEVAALPAGKASGSTSLRGFVFDQAGAPLMNVRLTLSGPAARKSYSDSEGAFAFADLTPGMYALTAEAPALGPVTQRNIKVEGSQTVELNLVMERPSAASVEQVLVLEKAPLVGGAAAKLDFELTDRMPPRVQENTPLSISVPPPARLDLSFAAPSPQTIPSRAEPAAVPLSDWRWPVKVTRRLFPGVRPEAFVVADLRSPVASALPAGEATLFLGDVAVGRTQLDVIRTGAPLTVAVGIDRAVRAKRQIELFTSEAGLPFAKKVVNRYTVTIDVANPRPHPLTVEINDQVPRSADAGVTVTLEQSPQGATLASDSGTLSWRAELKAGSTARYRFVYRIAHRKGKRLAQ